MKSIKAKYNLSGIVLKTVSINLILLFCISCSVQKVTIEIDKETPNIAQIKFTEKEEYQGNFYITFRDDFDSDSLKVFVKNKLVDESDLELLYPSFGYPNISILKLDTKKIKMVFDNQTFSLKLDKEYPYVFIDEINGKMNALFSKYVKFHF